MVDAAVGGKVAVNHREGKNLIGAFHQPRFVLADVASLTTLPARALREGWAEAIKHAMIFDPELLAAFEREAERIIALDPAVVTPVVERSIALKANVVSRDPKETGVRMVLNYGHTIGHALEAATAYGELLHGEAVAIGMMGAAEISHRMGLLDRAVVSRQRALLERFGLPVSAPASIDVERVLAAMSLDKKVSGKAIRWILLRGVGQTVVRNDVPLAMVRDVVEGLMSS
jgi:3-dehydroquinate synthetase